MPRLTRWNERGHIRILILGVGASRRGGCVRIRGLRVGIVVGLVRSRLAKRPALLDSLCCAPECAQHLRILKACDTIEDARETREEELYGEEGVVVIANQAHHIVDVALQARLIENQIARNTAVAVAILHVEHAAAAIGGAHGDKVIRSLVSAVNLAEQANLNRRGVRHLEPGSYADRLAAAARQFWTPKVEMDHKAVQHIFREVDKHFECSLRGLKAKYDCMYEVDPLKAHGELIQLQSMVGKVVEHLFKEVMRQPFLKGRNSPRSKGGRTVKHLKQDGGMKLLKNVQTAITRRREETKRSEADEKRFNEAVLARFERAYDYHMRHPKETFEYMRHITQLRNGIAILKTRIATISHFRKFDVLALEIGGRSIPRSRLLAPVGAAIGAKAIPPLALKALGAAARYYGVPTDVSSLLAALIPDAVSNKFESIMDLLQSLNATVTGMTSTVVGAATTAKEAAGSAALAVTSGIGGLMRRVGAGAAINTVGDMFESAKEQAAGFASSAAKKLGETLSSAAEGIGKAASAASHYGGKSAEAVGSFVALLLFLYLMYRLWMVIDAMIVRHNEKVEKLLEGRERLPNVNREAFNRPEND